MWNPREKKSERPRAEAEMKSGTPRAWSAYRVYVGDTRRMRLPRGWRRCFLQCSALASLVSGDSFFVGARSTIYEINLGETREVAYTVVEHNFTEGVPPPCLEKMQYAQQGYFEAEPDKGSQPPVPLPFENAKKAVGIHELILLLQF